MRWGEACIQARRLRANACLRLPPPISATALRRSLQVEQHAKYHASRLVISSGPVGKSGWTGCATGCFEAVWRECRVQHACGPTLSPGDLAHLACWCRRGKVPVPLLSSFDRAAVTMPIGKLSVVTPLGSTARLGLICVLTGGNGININDPILDTRIVLLCDGLIPLCEDADLPLPAQTLELQRPATDLLDAPCFPTERRV